MGVPRLQCPLASLTQSLRYGLSGDYATVSQGEHDGVGDESPLVGRVRFTVGAQECHQVEEPPSGEDADVPEG